MQANYPIRLKMRAQAHTGTTAGLAAGYVQANLVILPERYAFDFLRFCQKNPKPCPLIAVSEAGQISLDDLAYDLDIRTDLPSYDIYKDGVYANSQTDITKLWQDDFVTFLIGCSFSFEQKLIDNGIALRHIEQGKNIAMYNTTIPLQSSGVFNGNMVVSMRPMLAADAIKAVQITASMPNVHGAPVHIGHPSAIGIADIANPDYGDSIAIGDNELPVFWACGVTPTVALKAARLPLAITHSPGCMLITDIKNKW